jgi:hypothetical protein
MPLFAASPKAITRRRNPRFGSLVAIVVLITASPDAQSTTSLQQVLDRMGTYLIEYETQLSSVVADEAFVQRVFYPPGLFADSIVPRRLDSELSFMRLPGGEAWLGLREVHRIDGRRLIQSGPRISQLLASGRETLTQARSIAETNSRHNLGLPRTINVPTAPLDVIHPTNRASHRYALRGHERIRGTAVTLVDFEEFARPTLVREPSGQNLVSSGRIWVEPVTGGVWRIEWSYRTEERPAADPAPMLRVEFARDRRLGILVPVNMDERFDVARGRGEGAATYRNFRRFQTSGRIVPQP